MKIVTTCPSEYVGVSRVFADGQQLGLWKFIQTEKLSLPLEADLVILGGTAPAYYILLDRIVQPKFVLWTSPLVQTELARVELEHLLHFNRDPRISRIWFGERSAAGLFQKGFFAPYPVAVDSVKTSDMAVMEGPFVEIAAGLEPKPREGIGFMVPFANPQKNILTQLAAVRLVQETHPEVALKTGGMTPEQKRFADAIGLNYEDLGWRTGRDYFDDIASCRMTLHATLSESFAYSVLDSMLLSTPCLVSPAVDWVPEGIGLICSRPHDPRAIANCISSLYFEERPPDVRSIALSVAQARNDTLKQEIRMWEDRNQ